MIRRLICALLLFAPAALADLPTTQPASQPVQGDGDIRITEHELRAGEQLITYRAAAGMLELKDDNGKAKAKVFHVAYERTGDGIDRATRPITFVFNGGPGAAAVWLHLGTAGPRIISIPPDGSAPPPPYRLEDNPDSWLPATDMVFIDPVGTGFSRPAEGEKGEQFFGLEEDITWVAEFIRLYVTRNQRWASPKFLAGESYGTTRAAGLAEHLLDKQGIALNGIILISSVLDFATIRSGGGIDLPAVLYLPSYTAIAHHHKRLPAELQDRPVEELTREVEQWTIDTYLPALAHGAALPAERRAAVAQQLAAYTGLSPQVIADADLRIDPWVFMAELLIDRRLVIGRFDGRLTAFEPRPLRAAPSHDPSLSRFLPAYTSTFGDYVRGELGYESDLKYEVLSDRVWPWNFGRGGEGFVNVADDLSMAIVKNPSLRVMFASGHHDLATPYFAARYTIDHLDIGDDLRKNVVEHRYPGGHMLYHVRASREALGRDIRAFIESTTAPPVEGRSP